MCVYICIYMASLMAHKVKNRPDNAGDVDSIPGSKRFSVLREAHCWNRPPWPGTTVTIRTSCFTTGGPGEEPGTNKAPPTGRVRERSHGDPTCPTTSQNPLQPPSWLSDACTTRKDSESEWLVRDNQETQPITINPEAASHVAELSSWAPSPSCSPPGCPFPIKSSAFSAHVSPWTTHFWVLDKSPLLGLEGVPLPATRRRRKWQPTPVFLSGKSHGQRSLAGYSPWGCKESDTTEQLTHIHCVYI